MKRRSLVNSIGLALLLGLGLHSPDAHSRRGVRIRSSGLRRGTSHAGPVMSRDELRRCVQQESTLNVDGESLDRDEAELAEKQRAIDSIEQTLERRKVSLDRSSQDAIDSYNGLVARHRRLVRAYNESIAPYNKRVAAYQDAQNSFNATCAGKVYYEDDMQAVRAALR